MPMTDHYLTLGLERHASSEEIKAAFRRLARMYHPDLNSGDDEKFKRAAEAYTVLSDPRRRAQYDGAPPTAPPPPEEPPSGTDYYEVLGIEPSASFDEVRDAFQRLSSEHRLNVGNGSADSEFRTVLDAYRLLADPESRRKYDRTFARR
jgi:DnaJ-class molecular chaperone